MINQLIQNLKNIKFSITQVTLFFSISILCLLLFALTGVFNLNSLYIQSIGSGMGIYNGILINTFTLIQHKFVEALHPCLILLKQGSQSKGGSINKFLPDISSFTKYLNTLSLLELSALFHISILTLLILLTFNLLSLFFTNEFINHFKLENKFPKLATYFQYRLKFFRYYVLINITIIILIAIFTIGLDVFVLI